MPVLTDRTVAHRKTVLWLPLGTLLTIATPPAFAAFTFNWQPLDTTFGIPEARCNVSGLSNLNCATNGFLTDSDKTRFIQELVTEGGVAYYHVVIGEPSTGFAQEVYIQRSGGCNGFAQSHSSGSCGNDSNAFATSPAAGSGSGGGTGNVTRVVMKQVMSGAEYSEEFFKDSLSNKPIITQNITATGLNSQFIFDMRNSDYGTNTTAGAFTNTLTLSEPGLGDAGDFDQAADAQSPHVTGGRYTWISGPGFGSSYGGFSYIEGVFDVYAVDWLGYRDAAQNPGGGGCGGPC